MKKLLWLQILLLLVVMGLGTSLTGNNADGVRMIHAGLGALSALTAAGITLLAWTGPRPGWLRLGGTVSLVFIVAAGFGGRLGETDYSTGLLVMRLSAVIALVSTAYCIARLRTAK